MKSFVLLVLLAPVVFSCNKLELLEHSNPLEAGCLHPEATNYEATAISDNGSCTFGNCSITSVSTTTDYTLVCPTQTIFSNGDSYTIGFDGVVIGQVESVELFLDETFIHSFGNWVTFYPDGERSFILPTNIQSSNCYTIRIILNGLYISNPFTIY